MLQPRTQTLFKENINTKSSVIYIDQYSECERARVLIYTYDTGLSDILFFEKAPGYEAGYARLLYHWTVLILCTG